MIKAQHLSIANSFKYRLIAETEVRISCDQADHNQFVEVMKVLLATVSHTKWLFVIGVQSSSNLFNLVNALVRKTPHSAIVRTKWAQSGRWSLETFIWFWSRCTHFSKIFFLTFLCKVETTHKSKASESVEKAPSIRRSGVRKVSKVWLKKCSSPLSMPLPARKINFQVHAQSEPTATQLSLISSGLTNEPATQLSLISSGLTNEPATQLSLNSSTQLPLTSSGLTNEPVDIQTSYHRMQQQLVIQMGKKLKGFQ